MSVVKNIFLQTVDILPSFNITDHKVLPYGLKAHTRFITWITKQVVMQQIKFCAKEIGLENVEIDTPNTVLHNCILNKDKRCYFVNAKVYNADGKTNINNIASVAKLYMQYKENANYRLVIACFGINFDELTVSFAKELVHVFSPQFIPMYVNAQNDKIQAFYHHKPEYRSRKKFLELLKQHSKSIELK